MNRTDEKILALRSALVHAVGKICESERGLEMEPATVATLSFVVEQYMKILATDLPAFASHAKRSSISVDDVLLVARRNPDVLARLNDYVETYNLRTTSKKKKTDETKATTTKKKSKDHVVDFDDDFFDDDYDDDDDDSDLIKIKEEQQRHLINKENNISSSFAGGSSSRPPSFF
uniref:Centromere protein S n=1 Tax=Aureoumbra lagunensis TaxID=44058 RepID=A0A6S8F0G9_9STRA|mmetsp:Transcript_1866/g.2838  ORF Transcript_1866/g.2838 Transcript_1866/m.2838 type:complete len:175 (+) Transcript_1866:38-562(+)|eukprot:CAMPEP_0197306484 /NCGR_PEP_ID=MMETSP0891-20130614/3423_1 /TAXON_ID=44058 ORGANISM="Aureoumbra lagunensis, Strain CCMP1510" /NCGR_SAMPLE_ID=MMETSP0891 /ASSEMBLY_ACC=CAM_ASM_000534 /LENGTH=174 /DNA_ID=CAMNT_0042788805 /DNA_START=42 /DNA_END=566 /DNA_ORIENTATION=+